MSYVLINKETNIADNVVEWDGNTNNWSPPETHIAISVENTPAVDWVWDKDSSEWVTVEGVGNGGIGDVWDGEKLVQPKPTDPPVEVIALGVVTPTTIEGGVNVID